MDTLKGLDKAFTVKTGPVFSFAICIAGKVMAHGGFHDRFKVPSTGAHVAEVDDITIVGINPIEVCTTIEHAVADGGPSPRMLDFSGRKVLNAFSMIIYVTIPGGALQVRASPHWAPKQFPHSIHNCILPLKGPQGLDFLVQPLGVRAF